MNTAHLREHIQSLLKKVNKFKYTAIIFLIGIVLLLLPQQEAAEMQIQLDESQVQNQNLEERLENLLSQVEGAGKVDVLLSYERGEVRDYQEDKTRRQDETREEFQTETVFYDTQNGDTPVCVSVSYPTYRGAVVVCQGADKASVRFNILKAVSSLTGLGSDHITVIKMKGK